MSENTSQMPTDEGGTDGQEQPRTDADRQERAAEATRLGVVMRRTLAAGVVGEL